MTDQAIDELVPIVGTRAACAAVGRPRATHYRHHRHSPPPSRPARMRAPQPRALSEVERKEVLRVLHDPEHVDEAPATVYAKLLDAGVYLCSVPTMYRILAGASSAISTRGGVGSAAGVGCCTAGSYPVALSAAGPSDPSASGGRC